MKHRIIFILISITMLFGCNEDYIFNDLTKSENEANLSSEMTKKKNGKAVTKSIKIKGAGIVEHTLIYYDTDENPVYLAEVEGKGNASHLGLFTIELEYYTGPDFLPISPIQGTQTAANGDKLNTFALGPNPDGSIRFFYDGGTGRFEEVTGYADLFFDWSDDNNYVNYGEGKITY